MLQFDKLMLSVDRKHINLINPHIYEQRVKEGIIIQQVYEQTDPCYLYLKIKDKKVIIKFSGKLTGSESYKLISQKTINNYLDKVKEIAGVEFTNAKIIQHADVCSCDLTVDCSGATINSLKEEARRGIKNAKWEIKQHKTSYELIKKVTTKRNRQRIIVYDKEKEMNRAENRSFIAYAGEGIVEHFKNTIRFELNIYTMQQIRDLLNIDDNKLHNVLNSTANPISDVYDQILAKPTPRPTNISPYKQFQITKILAHYDNNLSLIEHDIRQAIGRSPRPKIMNEYREVLKHLQYHQNNR